MEEPACSEADLEMVARELGQELRQGDRVLLEGPMGAGKTTFARALLAGLGVVQPPEGSPSFAIAHEYESPRGTVIHTDLYRIRHESEIEDAGLNAYFWEREAIVIAEWVSTWPEFQKAVLRTGPSWLVTLNFSEKEDRRALKIEKSSGRLG